ncbi:MAG: hypothetical protein CK530_09425, partial [Planctomycetaceae bacterium]
MAELALFKANTTTDQFRAHFFFGGPHSGVVQVYMGDASVKSVSLDIAPQVWWMAGDRKDGLDARNRIKSISINENFPVSRSELAGQKTCQKPFLSEVGSRNFSSPAVARYFISPQSLI